MSTEDEIIEKARVIFWDGGYKAGPTIRALTLFAIGLVGAEHARRIIDATFNSVEKRQEC